MDVGAGGAETVIVDTVGEAWARGRRVRMAIGRFMICIILAGMRFVDGVYRWDLGW